MVDLDKVVKSIKKQYSRAEVAKNIPDPVDFVSTGNKALDLVLDGGFVFGYAAELKGLSSSGKSLFIHQVMSNGQNKYNAICILVDRENAYTNKRGEQLGIDNSRLIRATPTDIPTAVEGFNFIIDTYDAIRKQEKDTDEKSYIIIGVDSLSAFDKDVGLEKSDSGRKAKSVHEGYRRVLSYVDSRTMLLVANQVTYKIGVLFGDNTTVTSGLASIYYSTIRLALEDRKKIIDPKRGNEIIGNWIGAEVIKTRLGACFRSCYIPHYYKEGIDYYGGYARLLADKNYLIPTNKTDFKSFKTHTLSFGDTDNMEKVNEFKIEKFLQEHPELDFKEYPEYYLGGEIDGEMVDDNENSEDFVLDS